MNTATEQTQIQTPESDEGAHMDQFVIANDDAAPIDPDFIMRDENGEFPDPETDMDTGPDQMPREAFRAVWATCWNIPGMMVADYKPLSITPEKKAPCDEAADALYELAEMHFPWMLDAQNSTIGAVARMVPFALVQVGAFRAIQIEKRRAKQVAQSAQAEPASAAFKSVRPSASAPPAPSANDNAPPIGGDGMDWMDQENAA